jgi:hypothetical protein
LGSAGRSGGEHVEERLDGCFQEEQGFMIGRLHLTGDIFYGVYGWTGLKHKRGYHEHLLSRQRCMSSNDT